jgi:hypothetical protein
MAVVAQQMSTQQTVAQQKAHEEDERHKAEARRYEYQTKVVEPEIKELSRMLCLRFIAEGKTFDCFDNSMRDFFVDLAVDTRYSVLDPKYPIPTVQEGKYKIRAQKNYYKEEFYAHIEVWSQTAVWAGYHNPGTPGWDSTGPWHKLQVLRELARVDKKLNDPTTQEGALSVLLRYCEQQAAAGTLSQEQQAALIVMQDSRRDKASRLK